MTPAEILYAARDRSADVAFTKLAAYGDNGDCGGAWVVISPARGEFVKHLKAEKIGFKHHAGGYAVPVCRNIGAQSRYVFEEACDAFVSVLKQHGIPAYTYSYAD